MKYAPNDPRLVPEMLELVSGLTLEEIFEFLLVLVVRLEEYGGFYGGLSHQSITLPDKRKLPTLSVDVYRITICPRSVSGLTTVMERAHTLGHEFGHILAEDVLGITDPIRKEGVAWDRRWYQKKEGVCDAFSDAWLSDKKSRIEVFRFLKELEEKRKIKTARRVVEVSDEVLKYLFPL